MTRRRGVPYLQTEERIVFGRADGVSTTVVFEAGVEYRFSQEAYMVIGWRGDPGEIQVQGTEQNPVVFTSYRATTDPQSGDWNGLHIEGGTLSASSIAYASFHYGGKAYVEGTSPGANGNLVVWLGGTIDVRNSTFTDSGGAGISINDLREVIINGLQCGDPSPTREDLIGKAMGSNDFEDNAQGAAAIRFPPPGHAPCPN